MLSSVLGVRNRKLRVLQALERSVAQFRTRQEIWPLRVPAAPLLLDRIIRRTLEHEAPGFDVGALRSRSLLQLKWEDGSSWHLWVIVLGSGIKLYCDSTGEESRILASGRRDSEIDSDALFLELLAESAGETFGIEFTGGPPSRVRASIDKRLLLDFFVHLLEVARMEDDVRRALGVVARAGDFRDEVARWLDQTMQ